MSKNHLAPKKKITIVPLELSGAVVAKRLKETIEKELRVKFEKYYLVLDSAIVRAMIQKESYGFNTFAGVRVGEIQEGTNPSDWYWIEGSNNVADMLTRGKIWDELKEGSSWQVGPLFLQEDEEQWPIESSYTGNVLPEEVKVINLQCTKPLSISNLIDATAYSDYYKLLRVTARVVSIGADPANRTLKNIAKVPAQSEISAVEEIWVKNAQQGGIVQVLAHFLHPMPRPLFQRRGWDDIEFFSKIKVLAIHRHHFEKCHRPHPGATPCNLRGGSKKSTKFKVLRLT